MKLVTSEQMKELDAQAIEAGISGEELMQAAGEAVADSIRRLAGQHQLVDYPILFVAGPGNNGGDAFVAAQALYEDDLPVECWIAGSERNLKGDALLHFKNMKKAGVPYQALEEAEHWAYVANCGTDVEMIVDGLLGTGANGEPHGIVAEAIKFIESNANNALIVSIDMPSGMAVHADLTVALSLPKVDALEPENIDFVGNLEVVDIGIPADYIKEIEGDPELELIHPSDLSPLFPRRPRDLHKGDLGHTLCIGGSKGFSGAIALASKAALSSGAGLVSVLVPEAIRELVAASMPELMVHTCAPDVKWAAVMVGPGMGRTATTCEQVLHLLATSKVPLILDADAISVLADHTDAIANAKCPVILTPHPGELATLSGLKVDDIQADRLGMAQMFASKLNATIVLKGAGTIVAAPGHPLAVNLTGNPGMATAGSGDVLAGLLAGLIGQGLPPFEAACAAVWIHGRSGDLAAAEKSQATLIASHIIDKLPEAFRDLTCR